jgi:hypothetical protein
MRKQQIAVIVFTLWLIVVSLIVLFNQHMDYILFSQRIDYKVLIILWLIGFLIINTFMEPRFIKPGYTRYIKYLTAVSVVIFFVIVALKIRDYLV